MKRLRARFPFRKWITGKGEFRLLVGTAARFFLCAVSGEPAETRRNAKPDDCSTPFEIHNHLFTTQQGNWLAGQTRPDSSCQFSLAQYCMPTPTVGQIRRANACVRRVHQFADLKLTFLSIPPEQLRFVIHTDFSSKYQDETGRAKGEHYWATNPSMERDMWRRGHLWYGNRTS